MRCTIAFYRREILRFARGSEADFCQWGASNKNSKREEKSGAVRPALMYYFVKFTFLSCAFALS
jgi:hypothetical protein